MTQYFSLSEGKTAFIPTKYSLSSQTGRFKEFQGRDLRHYNKIFKFIQDGGFAVCHGTWREIIQGYDYLQKKKNEFFKEVKQTRKKHILPRQYQEIFNRFGVLAQGNTLLVDPPQDVPFLFNFTGETENDNHENCYYIPVSDYLKITEFLIKKIPVDVMNVSFVTHYTVLPPTSQKIYHLFQRTLESLIEWIPQKHNILDMGCGSGILTCLAEKVMHKKEAMIYSTDILAEAIGTCKYNISLLHEKNIIDKRFITVLDCGDLFEHITSTMRFHIILFNPPWAIHKNETKENKATADLEFAILKKFLNCAKSYLMPKGNILLCYTDHSGQSVIDTVEKMIHANGYEIQSRFKEEIRRKSISKKYEKLYLYLLSSTLSK